MKFNKALLITKLKATGVHFSLSMVVFIYLAYQIYFNWYPMPYFLFDGGWQGIRLVAAVDLVLGPLITFLIFDLRKSRRAIFFDLATIAVIQISALAYGIYATYSQRPVAIVMLDEFVVSSVKADYGSTLESLDQLSRYSDEKPPVIYAEMPDNQEDLARLLEIKTEQGISERAQIGLYREKPEFKSALQAKQLLFTQRIDDYEARDKYDAWLAEQGKSADEVLIAPFQGRYGQAWLVFDLDANYLSYF